MNYKKNMTSTDYQQLYNCSIENILNYLSEDMLVVLSDKDSIDKYISNKILMWRYIIDRLKQKKNNKIEFELRGDDLERIDNIKDYIPTEREDIWSWLCYLENTIKEQK